MNENEENMRDLAAMFAMCGLLINQGAHQNIVGDAYDLADAFIDYRNRKEDGIASITPKRKYERRAKD
jgi:hypothetical protein